MTAENKIRLKITAGPLKDQSFEFTDHDTFLVGRSRSCHVTLPKDPFLSRHHFLLEIAPPDARLRDLGSMNGTYVDGVCYGGRRAGDSPEQGRNQRFPEAILKHGSRINVGETAFEIGIETAPKNAAAPSGKCSVCSKVTEDPGGPGVAYLCEECWHTVQVDPTHLSSRTPKEQPNTVIVKEERDGVPALNGYELGPRIGQGGMSVVFRATRRSDGATVAIKLFRSPVAVEEAARKLFLREMEMLRELRHANIVKYHGAGTELGAFYMVMEYCAGGSVMDLMAKHNGPIPLDIAVPIMVQTLRGLAYAHAAKTIHRDIKPHNILLSDDDKIAKLADFGLAKNFEEAGLSGLTATGDFGGTFPYMPREQLTQYRYARPVSDVWGIAATFYRMLTAHFPRNPSADRDPIEVVLSDDAVPILERGVDLPKPMAQCIDRALSTEPNKRYRDGEAFLLALNKTLKKPGV